MHWLQVRIDLGELQADLLEQALIGIGAIAIEYSDAADEPIFEESPGEAPGWQSTQLAALFDASASETAIQLRVAASISPAPMPGIRFVRFEDQNWEHRWQQTHCPMQFGQNLWVCAPGQNDTDPTATVVKIAPGLGFGTGSHATTRLCLEWLAKQSLGGKTLLDVGCGSGILAIAALALGARRAVAIDSDDNALTATRDNAARNQCLERLDVFSADRLDNAARFDLIVANILSNTLIELEPNLRGHCQSGTGIALSGILTSQVAAVQTAYAQWIELALAAEKDDWVILTGAVH
jgi:ribosomal protein L11 methyltransferase